jgi:Domain of unknown function (DUF4062)
MAKKLQVFVSSTYSDLKQERQAAVAAILKAGHIPAGMELFTAGDQSQLDTIKAWIDESDIYMLILGGRYGSIDPTSKKSYTELEFDYALSKGKPTFSVVITEAALEAKVQSGGTPFIETKNGNALETFRNRVLTYISSFFEDDKDIRLTVYESLADFAAKKELVGWVPGNAVVDTIPLFEQIKKLSDENSLLRGKVSELERRVKTDRGPDEEFNTLSSVLTNDKILVPKAVNKEGPFDLTLLSVFLQAQDAFSSGIENTVKMSNFDNFLFFTVAPRLQIHGLVEYEKVAGVRYRRCTLTQKGARYLSETARREAQNKPTAPKTPVPEEEHTKAELATKETAEEPAKSKAEDCDSSCRGFEPHQSP